MSTRRIRGELGSKGRDYTILHNQRSAQVLKQSDEEKPVKGGGGTLSRRSAMAIMVKIRRMLQVSPHRRVSNSRRGMERRGRRKKSAQSSEIISCWTALLPVEGIMEKVGGQCGEGKGAGSVKM